MGTVYLKGVGYCVLLLTGSPEPVTVVLNSPTLLNNNPLASWDWLAQMFITGKMKEIRFTLGKSLMWHSLYFDLEVTDVLQSELALAYFITQELKTMGISESAKQVKVFDENHKEIASSKDIAEIGTLKIISNEK